MVATDAQALEPAHLGNIPMEFQQSECLSSITASENVVGQSKALHIPKIEDAMEIDQTVPAVDIIKINKIPVELLKKK